MKRRGVPAPGNGALVGRLASIANAIVRPPATVEEAKAMLGLDG